MDRSSAEETIMRKAAKMANEELQWSRRQSKVETDVNIELSEGADRSQRSPKQSPDEDAPLKILQSIHGRLHSA